MANADQTTDTPAFDVLDWYEIAGRGRVATTLLDRDCPPVHPPHLPIGSTVTLRDQGNEARFRVLGVETFAHAGPRRKGEGIGLLVEALTND